MGSDKGTFSQMYFVYLKKRRCRRRIVRCCLKEEYKMAETLTTLKNRRSCRAYKSEHVEAEKLNVIMEAGTYAATGMGKQSPIILVVKDQ